MTSFFFWWGGIQNIEAETNVHEA